MAKIKQMTTALANQIAAGEVVERPSSVVKELVENSIDAGADQIDIQLIQSGIQSIQVTDNGSGMDQADLLMACLPHATSKIFNVHDLFHIHSLGFRGEALASISSVARLRIASGLNQADTHKGYYVYLEDSNLIDQGVCPPIKGCIVEVKDLFYNTPARLKHLASLKTELRHSLNIIQDLALAYPGISFKLSNDGQNIISTNGKGDFLQAIANVYQPSIARQMLEISAKDKDFSLEGYISPPQLTRASRTAIHWMVNGRPVKSSLLTNVLLKAYGKQLMIGRFPLAMIQIRLDPQLVDVNVHPRKQTIRLSKEDELCHLLTQVCQERLNHTRTVPEAGDSLFKAINSKKTTHKTMTLEESLAKEKSVDPTNSFSSLDSNFERAKDYVNEDTNLMDKERNASINDFQKFEKIEENAFDQSNRENKITSVGGHDRAGIDFNQLRYVGQIHGSYLIAESERGFYLIDQHAAQERIRYEMFMSQEIDPNQHQSLLIPMVFQFDPNLDALFLENEAKLRAMGLELEPFGLRSYQLEYYPIWLEADELETLIPEIIERLASQPDLSPRDLKEASLIMQSCRGAIKANHHLSNQEAETLIKEMQYLKDPYHCPHGRPVFVEFDQQTIEKLFKRIMDSHQGGREYD